MSNLTDTRANEIEATSGNMAMSMAGGGPSAPQMNVTPMIDVLLVLIVIFMVIVMQSKTKGLEAQVPQLDSKTSSAPPPGGTIVIQLQENGGKDEMPRIKINSQEVSWADLEPRLFDIYKQRAEKVAFVEGDDGVEFRFVADVIDQARTAGVDRVGLMPKEVAVK